MQYWSGKGGSPVACKHNSDGLHTLGRHFMRGSRSASHGCAGFRLARHLSRREALRLGGLFGVGLTLPELLEAREAADDSRLPAFGKARRVIMLYLHGGHPQQETFDPKPHGPSAERRQPAVVGSLPRLEQFWQR